MHTILLSIWAKTERVLMQDIKICNYFKQLKFYFRAYCKKLDISIYLNFVPLEFEIKLETIKFREILRES